MLNRLPLSLLESLDDFGHRWHLNRWLFRRVCDAYEERLHVPPR